MGRVAALSRFKNDFSISIIDTGIELVCDHTRPLPRPTKNSGDGF
jgi:hypothetical protein